MALTKLQKEVMASIAKNRSETSYVAGGLGLNMNWPRLCDHGSRGKTAALFSSQDHR
ncbi:hypothetical protein [Rhizobium leucaenae]|uniref:Uncharacterized protein n=1 Tax=Rhizobium leucaenae TaxID=29450 RepID=A0A7W6ZW40_9HYPH|nr:hypothetical protein [Rhizobium leucaenae]MBB4569843.1 hypothetical protein [Rhizobium leucaenae]MBB6299644.1 hypothetical protein [Rhizobium leucaenae]